MSRADAVTAAAVFLLNLRLHYDADIAVALNTNLPLVGRGYLAQGQRFTETDVEKIWRYISTDEEFTVLNDLIPSWKHDTHIDAGVELLRSGGLRHVNVPRRESTLEGLLDIVTEICHTAAGKLETNRLSGKHSRQRQ